MTGSHRWALGGPWVYIRKDYLVKSRGPVGLTWRVLLDLLVCCYFMRINDHLCDRQKSQDIEISLIVRTMVPTTSVTRVLSPVPSSDSERVLYYCIGTAGGVRVTHVAGMTS